MGEWSPAAPFKLSLSGADNRERVYTRGNQRPRATTDLTFPSPDTSMDSENRAFLLGVGGGFVYAIAQRASAEILNIGFGTPRGEVLVRSALVAVVTLAAIPGSVAVGAYRMGSHRLSWTVFAAVVAAGTATGLVVADVTLASRNAPGLQLTVFTVAGSLVNALTPAVTAGVSALAGSLLAEQNA
jgi:hypothetical protein